MATFKKSYSNTAEFNKRQKIFLENKSKLESINKL